MGEPEIAGWPRLTSGDGDDEIARRARFARLTFCVGGVDGRAQSVADVGVADLVRDFVGGGDRLSQEPPVASQRDHW